MSQLGFNLEPAGVDPDAAAAVHAALKASVRPNAPSVIRRVLSVETTSARYGKAFSARVEMFDGREGTLDVGRWSHHPDAWTHVWSDIGGETIVLRNGRWQRCSSDFERRAA